MLINSFLKSSTLAILCVCVVYLCVIFHITRAKHLSHVFLFCSVLSLLLLLREATRARRSPKIPKRTFHITRRTPLKECISHAMTHAREDTSLFRSLPSPSMLFEGIHSNRIDRNRCDAMRCVGMGWDEKEASGLDGEVLYQVIRLVSSYSIDIYNKRIACA